MKKLFLFSKQSCRFDLKTNYRTSILMKMLFSLTIISFFITPDSFSRQFDTNFGTVAFSAEIHDPFIGRKQELYSVLDSQNRTHIAWVKDNRNSPLLMYSVVDGNSVTHYEVDTDSVLNQQKKHPVLMLDNNEKPHLAWFVKRNSSQSCCPSGNFAVMYAEDTDGDGIFNVSQVSTNPMNPSDNTATEFADSYVNYMPTLMINESGGVEVAYISDTYQSISYYSYLVIARKDGESEGWHYEETLLLDDIIIYTQDAVFFPPNSSETYYGLVKDISPDDIELVTNASGSWTKTSITNDPDHEVDHPQIARDSQGNYHVFYFYNDRDLDKLFVKHLTLSGASVASTETIELNEYTNTNYIYAAIDPITDDIYYAYTGYDSGYNEYLVYFEEGVKQEIMLREDGTFMGYHALNANNGFVSLVTASESEDSIYVTTNLFENDVVSTEFEGADNESVTQNPGSISLFQNYPNPFNPSTKISFELPEAGNISIEIYNLLGQKLLTLVDNRFNAGWHEITFNGSNLPSGLYVYRLVTPTTSINKKMTLIK